MTKMLALFSKRNIAVEKVLTMLCCSSSHSTAIVIQHCGFASSLVKGNSKGRRNLDIKFSKFLCSLRYSTGCLPAVLFVASPDGYSLKNTENDLRILNFYNYCQRNGFHVVTRQPSAVCRKGVLATPLTKNNDARQSFIFLLSCKVYNGFPHLT